MPGALHDIVGDLTQVMLGQHVGILIDWTDKRKGRLALPPPPPLSDGRVISISDGR